MSKVEEKTLRYDVVVDVLQKHYDKLLEMTNRNLNSEFMGMGIMDDIRIRQMEELKQAMELWMNRNRRIE
jgi:hypothetical protein